jgi:hypothetical protein
VSCQVNQPCSAIVVDMRFREIGQVRAASGPKTTLKVSFGATAKIHPCSTSRKAVLTFTGHRKKVIRFAFLAKKKTKILCYGQPHKFITRSGKKTTFHSRKNHEWEGALPTCRAFHTKPCLRSSTLHNGVQTVVVVSRKRDPHLIH